MELLDRDNAHLFLRQDRYPRNTFVEKLLELHKIVSDSQFLQIYPLVMNLVNDFEYLEQRVRDLEDRL